MYIKFSTPFISKLNINTVIFNERCMRLTIKV